MIPPSPAAPRSASVWRREPFRLFFPLGVLLAWGGVGHWLLYTAGLTSTLSCQGHGFAQTEGFLMAFAAGFLFTALPRRTQSAPPAAGDLAVMAVALVTAAAAALTERWVLGQLAYLTALGVLVRFVAVRFSARAGRRPPAAFALLPVGVLHGAAGATLLAAASRVDALVAWTPLARDLVEQGVFLCLVMGAGSLVLPLIAGAPPPADLGTSPRESWKAVAYLVAGVLVFASFLLEHGGAPHLGPLVRGVVVAIVLLVGAGAWRPPKRPGLHRRLVWLGAWLTPAGLLIAGVIPDYRIPALHVLFIGGFGLLAFAVATHVTIGHLGLETLTQGRPPALVLLGASFLLAMLARFAADWSESYFAHIGSAAALWLLGSGVWLAAFAPRLLRP